jgi:hypothetical protein
MADVGGKQGLTPEEEAHRRRIEDSERWMEEVGKTEWQEAQDSARMLAFGMLALLALGLALVAIFVVPVVVEWLSN